MRCHPGGGCVPDSWRNPSPFAGGIISPPPLPHRTSRRGGCLLVAPSPRRSLGTSVSTAPPCLLFEATCFSSQHAHRATHPRSCAGSGHLPKEWLDLVASRVLRAHQTAALDVVAAGGDLMLVARTGGGKSLVFRLAAAAAWQPDVVDKVGLPSLTLVLVPFISLGEHHHAAIPGRTLGCGAPAPEGVCSVRPARCSRCR